MSNDKKITHKVVRYLTYFNFINNSFANSAQLWVLGVYLFFWQKEPENSGQTLWIFSSLSDLHTLLLVGIRIFSLFLQTLTPVLYPLNMYTYQNSGVS